MTAIPGETGRRTSGCDGRAMTTLRSTRAASGRRLATLRRSGRRRQSASPIRRAMQVAAAGAAVFLTVGTGWPMPVGTTMLLGVALIIWIVGTFALERPEDG